MLEKMFKSELQFITGDREVVCNTWLKIKREYSKPGRFYHNLRHLDAMAGELLAVKDKIIHWRAAILSIAYHDLIYNPGEKDNEERSAKYAAENLAFFNISPVEIQLVLNHILATKDHCISQDSDTNYFIDADIFILGADRQAYQEYTRLIRKEYCMVPEVLYKPGRERVLKYFLEMHSIFKTDFFKMKYELKARKNIEWELSLLSQTSNS